jgi:hypothetical protein
VGNENYSYKQSVEKMCFGCGYSKGSAGTWRQQIAACLSLDCPNFYNRPVPDGYRIGGVIDQAACNKLADILEARDSERSRR